MKIYQVMMFMLIFNVMITVVGALHIYNMDVSGTYPYDEDIEIGEQTSNSDDMFWIFLGGDISVIIAGAIAGALGGYFLARVPTAQGVAYGLFGGVILDILLNTHQVLMGIVQWIPDTTAQVGVAGLVWLFTGICGILFLIGFLQLIVGGMTSYL